MNYKVLYNPALLINEMILFGDTLLNMSVNVKLFSNKINLISYKKYLTTRGHY